MALASLTMYNMIEYFQNTDQLIHADYKDYHSFPIATVNGTGIMSESDWETLDIDPRDLVLQLSYTDGRNDLYKYDHYHEIGHQMVMILGEDAGYPKPNGMVKIKQQLFTAREYDIFYFATGKIHGFRGSFHFINIQDPPLVKNGKDDFVSILDV